MSHDVLISGAGPVGLFLACELRSAGCSVLVLEQAGDSSSPFKQMPFGLRGLWSTILDAFARRGMLDEIVSAQRAAAKDPNKASNHWENQWRRPGGHFAGIQFFRDKIDDARWSDQLSGPGGVGLPVTMALLETILTRRAEALGVEIRRGTRVEHVEPSHDGVAVLVGAETFSAAWLVGCDGAHSAVRKACGFAFNGTDPEFTGYSVQVDLDDPDALAPGRHHTTGGMYTFTPPGTIAMADFDGGAAHRTAALTAEHVEAVLRRVSGTAVRVARVALASTWTDRAFQVDDYRRGRVFLAGDAAHIHSPLGGQGLNLGLGDAVNLGWKLAAAIRGDAPKDLLDTYAWERHPLGAQILDWSRAQVALMRPDRSSRALRAIMRDLVETSDGASYFAERVWGLALRYDLGGAHPLVGRLLPDFTTKDGIRVAALLPPGVGVLLDLDPAGPYRTVAERWNSRVAYRAVAAREWRDAGAVLVRPDGIVAWVDGGTALDLGGASDAVARWFGRPD